MKNIFVLASAPLHPAEKSHVHCSPENIFPWITFLIIVGSGICSSLPTEVFPFLPCSWVHDDFNLLPIWEKVPARRTLGYVSVLRQQKWSENVIEHFTADINYKFPIRALIVLWLMFRNLPSTTIRINFNPIAMRIKFQFKINSNSSIDIRSFKIKSLQSAIVVLQLKIDLFLLILIPFFGRRLTCFDLRLHMEK